MSQYNLTLINVNNEKFYLNNKMIALNETNILEKIWLNAEINDKIINRVYEYKILNNYDFRYFLFNFLRSIDEIYQTKIIPILYGFSLDFNREIFEKSSQIGIIHLVIISGMHFNLLFLIFTNIFKKRFKFMPIIIIIVYWVLCFKTISVNRAFFAIIIGLVLKKYQANTNYKFLLVFGSSFLFTPNINILNAGYWLSFILSFLIKKIFDKSKALDKIISYFYIWILSISIQLIWKDRINLTSYVAGILFMPLIEILYLNLTIFILFPLIPRVLINFLEFLLNILVNYQIIIQNSLVINTIIWTISIFIFFGHFIDKKVK
ncbi:ComEC/Rec2 family competence protein [Mycoplasmopsis cynos]|uniref:ComEC/Rec2 family competence protein n=1 Tax=Mycoplasmopsis cynos TaxID=171284 RepID=UPI002AFE00B8|nr:ComEC/Rec2 family competence protein [Mycoplasmopsis cynos]WQQ15024.1 ComEC/Rec2 family competence protein [Mycoplasmopsis cynos]